MNGTIYLVTAVATDLELRGCKNTKLTWAEGMAGVMPVFENYEKAQKYAEEKGALVLELQQKV